MVNAKTPTAEAAYGIGRILYEGLGGSRNVERGLQYIRKAAEMGSPEAIAYLQRIKQGKV